MSTKKYLLHDRIIIDPAVMVGKPVIKGTRIPVDLILKHLAQDLNTKTLFEAYPRLTKQDIKACLEYAQSVVEGEDIYPSV